jgi:hypothetical protein
MELYAGGLYFYIGAAAIDILESSFFTMKTILKAILFILVFAVSVDAASYTVMPAGGNFSTIQACANAMSAGDTCTVFAGTYNERVTISAGGPGAYKTLTVNPGDTVFVLGFTISSHVKVDGFHIQNPSSPSSASCVSVAANSTDWYITNNNMYACSEFVSASSGNNSHGFIQGNKMSYTGSTSAAPNVGRAMTINGDFNLIENNNISHVSDGPYLFGAHDVLRKNTFHDVSSADCGSNSSNCHIDFMQADAVVPATLPTTYLLIEGNTVTNMVGANMHALGILQAESCNGGCQNAIIRFHLASHIGGGGIVDDNSFSSGPAWINVKAYNNSWIDVGNANNGAGNGTNGFTHNSTGGSEINDLFYYPFSLVDYNPYFTDGSTVGSFTAGHNLAYCTGTLCNLRSKIYGAGLFTDDSGNRMSDPKFADYASNDFSLLSGSPALAGGTYLTTVANADSGSGTSLVVNDAGYFQDGSGIPGVNSDCIAVATVANHVCVASVNYQTKTLTLTGSLTRSAGNPVWLYSDSTGRTVLIGSAPNIGASFDPNSVPPPPPPPTSPTPPTGLAATVN